MNKKELFDETTRQLGLDDDFGLDHIQLTEAFHILAYHMSEAERTFDYELEDGCLVYHITKDSIVLTKTDLESGKSTRLCKITLK